MSQGFAQTREEACAGAAGGREGFSIKRTLLIGSCSLISHARSRLSMIALLFFSPPCFAPNGLSPTSWKIFSFFLLCWFFFWGGGGIQIDRGANNSRVKQPQNSRFCFSFARTRPAFRLYSHFIIQFLIYMKALLAYILGRLWLLHQWTRIEGSLNKTVCLSATRKDTGCSVS